MAKKATKLQKVKQDFKKNPQNIKLLIELVNLYFDKKEFNELALIRNS